MDEYLTVKAVSRLSGVTAHTLRAWERRYGAVSPDRTVTGRRVYSLRDVEKLKLLSQLLTDGYAIGSIARLSIAELGALTQSGAIDNACGPQSVAPEPAIRSMLAALQGYQLDLLNHEMTRARMTFPLRLLILRVFGALLAEVGRLVAIGKMGIAQEHALSALIRGHLAQIHQSFSPNGGSGPRVVLSTPEGDLHEFGILMGAILCATHGMSVHYLGPNLPPEDLAEAAVATRAQLVLLGCTSLPPETTATDLKTYLKRLTKRLGPGTEVWVGGDCGFAFEKTSFPVRVRPVATLASLDESLELLFNSIDSSSTSPFRY